MVAFDLNDFCLGELGGRLLQQFLEVLPLRSKTMGSRNVGSVFPLPTSREKLQMVFPNFGCEEISWMILVCLALNSVWGGELFFNGEVSDLHVSCLNEIGRDVVRVCKFETRAGGFDWHEFFSQRTVDYQGEEVKVARSFRWANVAPALPKEVGRVPLEEVCSMGARYYVQNFDLYIKPREEWPALKKPKVMVKEADWGEVCRGLVDAGVCTLLLRDEVFEGPDGPLVNGLFGVTKDEMDGDVEVYRLIMNLIPLNANCQGIRGDVDTLPSWSMMNPLFLQPTENLVVSSEDVRCFSYTMRVPSCWYKYLAFNKTVPDMALPEELQGKEVYLASRVLPMGFVNSVSLAQHVHRNLATSGDAGSQNLLEAELRKDKPFTVANPSCRVYLDNFDVLEKIDHAALDQLVGSTSPSVLALRAQYEVWDVPRNTKKSVSRQLHAEIQGAMVDGEAGVAFPREPKLLKYVSAAMALCKASMVTQRQTQVVCGGLVYISMFRRPLLGCLNQIWVFIESFKLDKEHKKFLPVECKLELLRFLALTPLARLDFRVPLDDQVTCSDASTQGGGVCASRGLTLAGAMASLGKLRGELPEGGREHKVLSIGLFDGIGSLRVALEVLSVEVLGHVGVETNPAAARVVEANFPGSIWVRSVEDVTDDTVQSWSCMFSQASLVLVGGGPPCQGVSGLNASRKGALRDARSCLFVHVPSTNGVCGINGHRRP